MLLAVVSDLHANLQAWNAVLLDARSLKADRLVCLGDIVGYGPNPAEVLESIYANADHVVLGNHDAAVCGKIDDSLFNDQARRILDWTRRQLSGEAAGFLGNLPLSLDAGVFRCVHGDFAQPAAFNYVIDPEDALASWNAVPNQLLFLGHSHCPGIFVLGASGQPHLVEAQDFELEDGKRYVVNVGSVGQPRDGDTRSSYCLFDTASRSVLWRRIPFDLDAYREALHRSGVSATASYFLTHDPRHGRPELRKMLNFSPAQTLAQAARDVVEVRELKLLQRRIRRWKITAAVVGSMALIAAGLAGTFWWRASHRAMVLDGTPVRPVSAVTSAPEANLVAPPETAPPGLAIPGWRVELGDKRRQRVTAGAVDPSGTPGFQLQSRSGREPIRLVGPAVAVRPGMKLVMEALVHKAKGFQGNLVLVLSVEREQAGRLERIETFRAKEPNLNRRGGWLLATETIECPAGARSVQLQLRGRFTGGAAVKGLRLYRKE